MAKQERNPEFHVLDFFCDEGSSCALTAWLSNSRVHVIADASKLHGKSAVGAEYWDLVRRFEAKDGADCAAERKSDGSGDKNSDIDLKDDGVETPTTQKCDQLDDVEFGLQSWMLAPLLCDNNTLESTRAMSNHGTLQQWYHRTTQFFELAISKYRLGVVELEAIPALNKEMENILPSATLPKDITDSIGVPLIHASDLQVVECSDQPPKTPYHPCRVRYRNGKQTYFLKVVDNSQPETTRREVEILNRITKLRLDKQIHVPILKGLVSFDGHFSTGSERRNIMGFLQTDISNPTPLTNLLDPTIPQAKRDEWAKEAERINHTLHENEIVWGDAKADNFMVDAKDDLWIIDFGGSYTEGWVDAELKETEEGDAMGVEKTINALKDPELNTYDPDDHEQCSSAKKPNRQSGQKRKKNGVTREGVVGSGPRKLRRCSKPKA